MAEGRGGGAAVLGGRVRRGEVSAREVVEAALARTREVEPRLHAYVAIDADGARRRAEEIDGRVAAGEDPGPLAGVPLAVKDNLAVAGRPLTCGSRMLAGYVSPFSATAVERLEAAGAVILGATNLDEFAMGSSSETSAFGPTRNPWDEARSPGGSSGGSAVAVASGGAALALGSDTGGSVRQPAAFCGVAGLKPTWGRVSRWGLVAFASSLDVVGPLAGGVADLALALRLVAGPDGRDATCADEPVEDYPAVVAAAGDLSGVRVGVVREVAAAGLSPAMARVWQASLRRLAGLGADLVEVSVPALPGAVFAYAVLAAAEASSNLARFDGVRYGLRCAAPTLEETWAESRGRGFGAEVARRILLGTFALSAGWAARYHQRARAAAAGLREELLAALRGADLLVTPTTPAGPFLLGERLTDPLAMYRSDVFTVPANLAGLPALALPAGREDDGLPLSLQLLGRPFGEAALLAAGAVFEGATGSPASPRPRRPGRPRRGRPR
jgi:aspartyl-tRNA(Asn)/glutamyl-tRNA(Gln) amidotransferase subunit A